MSKESFELKTEVNEALRKAEEEGDYIHQDILGNMMVALLTFDRLLEADENFAKEVILFIRKELKLLGYG